MTRFEEGLRRLIGSIEDEIPRLLDPAVVRVAHDGVIWDEIAGTVEYRLADLVVRTLKAERIGTWSPEVRFFRWSWATRPLKAPPRQAVDEAFRQGHRLGIPELTEESVHLDGEVDARRLAALAAHLAGAQGVTMVEEGTRIMFLAVFAEVERPPPPARARDDRASALRLTAPPTARVRGGVRVARHPTLDPSSEAPPAGGAASSPSRLPPATPPAPRVRSGDRPAHVAREPPRDVFLPVAHCALGALDAGLPGFRVALVILRVAHDGSVTIALAAIDAEGRLQTLDPPDDLLVAGARMLAEERAADRGFQRLVARLTPSEQGATVVIETV